MRCLPHESEKLKYQENSLFIWINKDGEQTSFNDQPAHVDLGRRSITWKKDGKWHRDYDKPAFINFINRYQIWYIDNKLIRQRNVLD